MIKLKVLLALLTIPFLALSQKATLKGIVIDAISREAVSDAAILIQNTNYQCISNELGSFSVDIEPGIYNLYISHINYDPQIAYEHRVRIAQSNIIEIELLPKNNQLDEVSISVASVTRSAENGNNIKTIEIDEIQRMPGAVMDISKVIKNFPGVSPRVSFGYNIIVRGGGAFENKFYLDGIEIPAITHFNVQGLSGGPNGCINTDLISRATFKSGSFPSNRANILSSVLELEQKAGRRDRFGTKLTLGAAEYGAHIEGPLGKHSSYIFSARKSYTEYLLKAFNLPVLPAFTDFQYKHKIWLSNQDEITIVGLGTYDKYRLNLDGEATDALLYNTGYIPEGDQNSTVFGVNYKHFTEKGVYQFVASHNRFTNKAYKFYDNSGIPEDQSLDFLSKENETKFRLENKIYNNRSTFNYGVSYDFVDFSLNQYSIFANQQFQIDTLDFNSNLQYNKYGFFGAYSYDINARWNLYLGLRMDGSNATALTKNPFQQISPRASLQYAFSNKLSATIQSGIYYQLPPNILLGYSEENELVNLNELNYIKSSQFSTGIDYKISKERRMTVDVFYKQYDQYPFLLRDSISFANANGDYVAVGNQRANSNSKGNAYGIEFFYQQKLRNNWFGNVSSTYVVSQFEDKNGQLVNSAWDNRYFLNMTIGKELKKNWTIGAKFTYSGSSPYTAYDVNNSSRIDIWDANRKGIFDFDRINQERLPAYHALDFRVDKKWYLKKMTIIAFLDLQNLYNNKFQLVPYLTVVKDENGNNKVSSDDPSRYETQIINSDTGRVLPTIGFSIEI